MHDACLCAREGRGGSAHCTVVCANARGGSSLRRCAAATCVCLPRCVSSVRVLSVRLSVGLRGWAAALLFVSVPRLLCAVGLPTCGRSPPQDGSATPSTRHRNTERGRSASRRIQRCAPPRVRHRASSAVPVQVPLWLFSWRQVTAKQRSTHTAPSSAPDTDKRPRLHDRLGVLMSQFPLVRGVGAELSSTLEPPLSTTRALWGNRMPALLCFASLRCAG
jgi:hypothetical protein